MLVDGGRFLAVPYDGDNGLFRTHCLEVVDYLNLAPSKTVSSAVDMRAISPDWTSSRASETGEAVHFELYVWPSMMGPLATLN